MYLCINYYIVHPVYMYDHKQFNNKMQSINYYIEEKQNINLLKNYKNY